MLPCLLAAASADTRKLTNPCLSAPFAALPFCDADLRAPLDGTLFRLPLRTEQQAQRSAIAQHSFTDAEVGGLAEGGTQ